MSSLIQRSIPLADKNWFQTGGAADFYAEPFDAQTFKDAISFALNHNHHIFILGHGANILISDAGFAGLVIRPQLKQITVLDHSADSALVQAGSGVSMTDLIEFCLNHQLLGLEEFSGIPGTVGGSVYINLHYFEFLLAQFLVTAEVIEKSTGNIMTVNKEWFAFGYNKSTLQDGNYYLLHATFAVRKASAIDTAYARGRSVEIKRHRNKRYPLSHTCGSFFRNFHEHEVSLAANNKKIIFVAYYLDKIGAKGVLRRGDAIVSHQHANMIVNCGAATSADIIALARSMQEQVYSNFGIIPQPECILVGFDQFPLHNSHPPLSQDPYPKTSLKASVLGTL